MSARAKKKNIIKLLVLQNQAAVMLIVNVNGPTKQKNDLANCMHQQILTCSNFTKIVTLRATASNLTDRQVFNRLLHFYHSRFVSEAHCEDADRQYIFISSFSLKFPMYYRKPIADEATQQRFCWGNYGSVGQYARAADNAYSSVDWSGR